MEGPGKEEDLGWGAFLFGGADDGCYGFEVVLVDVRDDGISIVFRNLQRQHQ